VYAVKKNVLLYGCHYHGGVFYGMMHLFFSPFYRVLTLCLIRISMFAFKMPI